MCVNIGGKVQGIGVVEMTTEALTQFVTFYCTMYHAINSTSLSTVLSPTVCLSLNESMACGILALKKLLTTI